jgi:hypothetical protein
MVGSIHVKQVAAIVGEESVAISVVADPNGPTVIIQGTPSHTHSTAFLQQLAPPPETPSRVLDHSQQRSIGLQLTGYPKESRLGVAHGRSSARV